MVFESVQPKDRCWAFLLWAYPLVAWTVFETVGWSAPDLAVQLDFATDLS